MQQQQAHNWLAKADKKLAAPHDAFFIHKITGKQAYKNFKAHTYVNLQAAYTN